MRRLRELDYSSTGVVVIMCIREERNLLRRVTISLILALGLAACADRTTLVAPSLIPDSRQCLAELDRLGVVYQVEAPANAGSACAVATPVRVAAATAAWSQPAIASCGFVAIFDRFERESIRPLAVRYFGKDIRAIIDLGAYSCRRTRAGRESEHGRGMALDFAGVELADGSRVLVKEDWGKPGPSRAFLRAVAASACRYFNVVLTPDSDRDHFDHIHVDLGPYRLCVAR